VWYVLHIHH